MSTNGPAVPDPGASHRLLLGPGADGLAVALARWAAEARVEEAGAARARERWLRQQAEEEATIGGVLRDLAERRMPVVIETSAGRRHRVTVSAVARDFIVVRDGGRREIVLALGAVTIVRPEPGSVPPVGDRPVDADLRLADALSYLAAERPRVMMVTTSGEAVTGVLRSLGQDVATIDLDGGARAAAYVPIAAVTEIGLA